MRHRVPPQLRAVERQLREIPNVGPAMAADLIRLGVRSVDELAFADPAEMYGRLCKLDGVTHDPCVKDVFVAVVAYARTGDARPWWQYSELRKRTA
ncbi:MAG: helix-hairpin-helix domain-containing protein [Thermoplasmatota archaeon]